MTVNEDLRCSFQILKPINKNEAKEMNQGNNRGLTPPKPKKQKEINYNNIFIFY